MGRNLRRLSRAGVRHGSVDLRSRWAARRGTSDPASLTRARRSRRLRRLRRKAIRTGTLGILLEGRLRLLRRRWGRRRRSLKGRRARGHLVLRRLLLLLGRRGRRREPGLATLASHDSAEHIIADADGRWLLRRASVLRRAADRARGRASTGVGEISAQMGNLFFIPKQEVSPLYRVRLDKCDGEKLLLLFERHMLLLHCVDLVAHVLHLLDLCLDCGIVSRPY